MIKYILVILFCYTTVFGIEMLNSIIYFHPSNNAKGIRPQTSIIIKLNKAPRNDISTTDFNFNVEGSKSGVVQGIVKIISNTIIFRPISLFQISEKIEISFSSKKLGISNSKFHFYTSHTLELPELPGTDFSTFEDNGNVPTIQTPAKLDSEPNIINGVAVPRIFPILQPFIYDSAASSGKIFISIQQDQNPYLMILENDGTPYFYRNVENRTRDFKLQPTGQLTRMITPPGGLSSGWEILDSNYKSLGVHKALGSIIKYGSNSIPSQSNLKIR